MLSKGYFCLLSDFCPIRGRFPGYIHTSFLEFLLRTMTSSQIDLEFFNRGFKLLLTSIWHYILSKNENFTWYYTDLYMFAFIHVIEILEVH